MNNYEKDVPYKNTGIICDIYHTPVGDKCLVNAEDLDKISYTINQLHEKIKTLNEIIFELREDNEMIMDEYNRIGGQDVSIAINYLKTENEKCKEKLEMVGLTPANVSAIINDDALINEYNFEVLRHISQDLKLIDGFGESLIAQILINLKELADGLKRPIDKRLLLNTIISTITLDEDVDINILADLRKINYASFPNTVKYIEDKFKETKKLLIEG